MQPSQFAPMGGKPMAGGFSAEPRTSGKATAALILGIASLLCSCLTGLPALIFGFLALGDIGRSRGALKGKGLAITGIVLGLLFSLLSIIAVIAVIAAAARSMSEAVGVARQAAYSAQSANDLKQQGVSLFSHHDSTRKFPAVGNDAKTREGLSWRVQVLPYLEEAALYQQFDQESGWASPANMPLAAQRPRVYEGKLATFPPDGTPYLSPVSSIPSATVKMGIEDNASFVDIVDGTSNTAMIVLCTPMTVQGPWTMGYDLPVNAQAPSTGLAEERGNYLILTADGAIHRVSSAIDPQTLLHIMQRNDGNVVEF